jgi:hypothetical protein
MLRLIVKFPNNDSNLIKMLHCCDDVYFIPLSNILLEMKRKLFYAAGLLLIACSFKACDLIGGNCQICQTVSYENGNPIAWGPEAEYCDNELITIKATPPTTTGGVTTQWECR